MNENILTIKEFFGKRKFVIPNYQRGYKWGIPHENGTCAVSVLMEKLIDAYNSRLDEYFIHGVTVYETGKKENFFVTLIDGQQRTTTFYLLLKYLNYNDLPEINYSIRKESDYVLKNSKVENDKLQFDYKNIEMDYDLQDIFYFKKAIETIHRKFVKIETNSERVDVKEKFRDWILNCVKLFYITIASEDATKVFSMMNGQMAIMKSDELIKSALLSKASRSVQVNKQENNKLQELDELLQIIKKKVGEEWEINSLRSKYAREWDKWLYWWNREEVKEFWGSGNNPLGLLLEYYFKLNKGKDHYEKKYSFKTFNECFFCGEAKNAKTHYKGIRDLQKLFEDWYNNYKNSNYIGLIINGGGDKEKALLHFLKENSSIENMEKYAKWTLVGATHRQIITKSDELGENEETKEQKAEDVLQRLCAKEVYNKEGHSDALKQLLRKNVELDNNLGRKFDFSLYSEKSLEHIYPKSWENETESKLHFDKEKKEQLSVHCIGNLVLIKKNENSQFGAKSFEDKKKLYFNSEHAKWSLKFLHSVSVFSKKEWNEKSISENQDEFIKEFKKYYKIEDEDAKN